MPTPHESSARPRTQAGQSLRAIAHKERARHEKSVHHAAAHSTPTLRTTALPKNAERQFSDWVKQQQQLSKAQDLVWKSFTSGDGSRCSAAVAVAQRSACPSGRWQDVLTPLLAPANSSEPLVFVDVGANKGYNVAAFLQRYHRPDADLMSRWAQAIRPFVSVELPPGVASRVHGPHYALLCGNCWTCFAAAPPRPARMPVDVRVHALEIVAKNANLIRTALAALHVPPSVAHVHHMAVSNVSGSVTLSDSEMGLETSGIAAGGAKGGVRVRATTLDDFANRLAWPPGSARVISQLTIDAEGHDPIVLDGARLLLAERRIRIVEFEYNRMGAWMEAHALERTIERLHRWRYECFFQGNFGQLARASGANWCAAYEFRGWSNLVCAHEPALLDAMGKLAI